MAQAPQKIVGTPGGTYRQLDIGGVQERLKANRYKEELDPDAYSGLIDSYRDSYLGTIVRGVAANRVTGERPDGWDPLAKDALPKGYEQYADAFAYSQSPAQSAAIAEGIDARLANRERREKRGWGSTLVSDLAAGILDPTNLIAGPALKGVGLTKGFLLGGTFAAGVGVGQESIVAAGDPTMSEGEGTMRIGGALVGGLALGGTLGAVVGAVGRKGAKAGAPATVPFHQPSQDAIINHVLIDLEGGSAIAKWDDGNGGTTKFGFAQKFNKDIDVTTLTKEQAVARAKSKYWLPSFNGMDPAKAAVAFDANFISGSKKLNKAIARASDAGEALAIYRAHLNRLADADPTKPRKGWMNRLNKLSQFIGGREGGGTAGATRYDLMAAVGPRIVDFGERGYIPVRKGATGMTDEAGRPVMAAWVRERPHPVDEMTTMPVPERPERFETFEDQAAAPRVVGVPVAAADGAASPAPQPGRPRTRALPDEAPPAPRAVTSEASAATELDRLERGDFEAAKRTAEGPKANKRFEMEDLVQLPDGRWTTKPKGEADNLPFSTAAATLDEADSAFMTDVVGAKGFSQLNQPELNRLRDVIVKLADIDPEAARLWMGRSWDGGELKPSQVTKRLNALVAHRNGLKEKAPTYERDVTSYDKDKLRDAYDTAIASHSERLEVVDNEIDALQIAMRVELERLDEIGANPAEARAIKADHYASIRAQYDRRAALVDRLKEIRRNRQQDLGRAVDVDSVDEALTRNQADVMEFTREPPDDLKEMWAADRARAKLQNTDVGDINMQLQEKQELLMRLETNATTYVGRGEKAVSYTKKQLAMKAKLEAEMNDLLNLRYKVEAINDELADLLPFGVGGKVDGVTGAGGEMKIDVEALLKSYPDKPWSQPIEGVAPLSDDLFPTPESWVNFVYFHEREHVLNKRMEGETLGDYETRINNRAIEAMGGEAAPWKPVDGWKNELVLRPTPIGQLMQLVKNPTNYIWESIARLASDMDLRLQRNLTTGGASTPGGSVYQRAMRHSARAADFYNKLEDFYLVYARGRGTDGGPIVRGTTVWSNSRKAKKAGKMTFEDFDRAVGRAQASGTASGVKEVDDAAKLFNEIVEDMRRQEDELGLTPGKAAVERELNQLRNNIDALENSPHGPKGADIVKRWKERANVLSEQLANDVSKPGKKGLPYFTRLWDVGALMREPDKIKAILTEGFIKEGNDPKTASVKALEAYEGLIADPTSQSIEVAKTLGEFKSRELPVENDAVIDFIHTDASLVLHRYMRRTGAAIEMTRMFGDPSGDLEADRVLAELAGEGLKADDLQAAMQIWYDARDRIVGAFHGENPMSMSNRVVRGVKRWTRFAVMGMSGITQITDFARAAWIVGPKSLAKGAFAPLFSQMASKDPGKYAHAVGEALDFEVGMMSRRAMDDDDWTFRVKENGIERLMGDLEIPFFILNGVTPLTNMLKRAVARATPHLVLDRARAVAKAVREGAPVPQEQATWLREHGIDEHDAMLLVDLPVEESKGGFIMADLDDWGANHGAKGQRGADLLMGVLSGNTRRAVATPGPLNRPRVLDGIMIDKKARSKAWEDRWVAEKAESDARDHVIELRKAGFERGDPDFDAAVDALGQATGVHTRARLNVGVKGRKERPIASIPFQLQSFSFSQTSKLMSSMLTGRDKHVLVGFLGMWGAGIVGSWLKGEIAGTNENASIDEHMYRGLMSTGFLTWMQQPLDAAKGMLRMALGEAKLETPMGDVDLIDPDRPGIGDNIAALGPSVGLAIGALEGMFGTGFDGQDLPASDRVYQLRRTIPFGNLLYFNWLMRSGFNAMAGVEPGKDSGSGMGAGPGGNDAYQPKDEYSRTFEQMAGFSVGDEDPRQLPADDVAKPEEIVKLKGMEPTDLIATVMAMKKSKRPRRPAVVPLALQFAN